MTEQEAELFLSSLEAAEKTDPPSIYIDDDTRMIKQNQEIIDTGKEMMLERFKHNDSSLRVQDINAITSEAFKQNQQLQGNSEDYDSSKLIPTQINIQIINN